MNQKILALILFSILLCLNVNAEIENGSFEIEGHDFVPDTNAKDWENIVVENIYAGIYSDTNGICHGWQGAGIGGSYTDAGRQLASEVGETAENGDYIFRIIDGG